MKYKKKIMSSCSIISDDKYELGEETVNETADEMADEMADETVDETLAKCVLIDSNDDVATSSDDVVPSIVVSDRTTIITDDIVAQDDTKAVDIGDDVVIGEIADTSDGNESEIDVPEDKLQKYKKGKRARDIVINRIKSFIILIKLTNPRSPQVLMVLEHYGKYGFPGGSRNGRSRETELECAIREFKEETEANLPPVRCFIHSVYVYNDIEASCQSYKMRLANQSESHQRPQKRILMESINLYIAVIDNDVDIEEFQHETGEIKELRWIPISELSNVRMLYNFRPCFRQHMPSIVDMINYTILDYVNRSVIELEKR